MTEALATQAGQGRSMTSDFAAKAAFSTSADQPVLQFLGAPERLMLAGAQSGGEFALFQSAGERGHTAPRHRHRHASETFIVLDGELLVQAGAERLVVGPGDVAVLPRDQEHTFLVVSATARYLTLHTPAGFDAFVRAVSDAAQAGGGAPPDRAALIALAAGHGIDITGPGLTLDDYDATGA
jgi:quercetin dioxygenase-like cupin family protein